MQQFNIDISNPGGPRTVYTMQGDSLSRFFEFTLTEDAAPWTPPESALWTVRFGAPGMPQGWYDTIQDADGSTHPAVVVSGNTVTVEIAEPALAAYGKNALCVIVYTAQGYQLASWAFMLDIGEVPGQTAPQVDTYYNLLTEQVTKVLNSVGEANGYAEDAANSANAAAESASAAAQSAQEAASAVTGVVSFNGRQGAVMPQGGDYTPEMVGALASDGTAVASRAVQGAGPYTSANSYGGFSSLLDAIKANSQAGRITYFTAQTRSEWADTPTTSDFEYVYTVFQLSGTVNATVLASSPRNTSGGSNVLYIRGIRDGQWSGNWQTVGVESLKNDIIDGTIRAQRAYLSEFVGDPDSTSDGRLYIREKTGANESPGSIFLQEDTDNWVVNVGIGGKGAIGVNAAAKLKTARSIGNASFDGSADITLAQIGAMPVSGGTFTGNVSVPKLTNSTADMVIKNATLSSINNQRFMIRPGGETAMHVNFGVVDGSGTICTEEDVKYNLGTSSKRFNQIYLANQPSVTSDERQKNSITDVDEATASAFLEALRPSTFKLNDGESGRTHWGFISQQVEQAMTAAGLTDMDFAGFIRSPKYEDVVKEDGTIESREVPGEYVYSLRYGEFIPVLTSCIQQLQKQVTELQKEISALKTKEV